MKPYFFLSLFISIFFIQCSADADNIAGLYVSSSTNEFSTVTDSLRIASSDRPGEFAIIRNMLINYLRTDERLPQHRTERWIAVYDGKTNSMLVRDNGKNILLLEENNVLQLGKTQYKKVAHDKVDNDIVLGHQ